VNCTNQVAPPLNPPTFEKLAQEDSDNMASSHHESLEEHIEIHLSKAACLLLFELLTNAYEAWRTDNPDDATAEPMLVCVDQHAARRALWQLEGAIERTLPEVFSKDYEELLDESKRLLG
jgi:hypothetical protein